MRRLLVALLALIAVSSVSSQTGRLLDETASQGALSADQAINLVSAVAGLVRPGGTERVDVQQLRELGYRIRFRSEGVTAGEFALLVMQLFDVRGDLRYELLPGPVSAFHVFKAKGFYNPHIGPQQPLEGATALELLARFVRADWIAGDSDG